MLAQEFRHTRRVHFQDTDLAGIIHFSNYFRYMEETETEFLYALGAQSGEADFHEWFLSPRVGVQAEFLRPTRFGDKLDVMLSVEHMGRSSIGFRFRFLRGDELVARGSMRAVYVGHNENGGLRSTAIPDKLRPLLEPYLVKE
ncbi:MAG: acyl-CoA thioesterase [Acidobacteria bacterium]|nr:acyl-CoA thioesterase [Acidobacteriota bacterium]